VTYWRLRGRDLHSQAAALLAQLLQHLTRKVNAVGAEVKQAARVRTSSSNGMVKLSLAKENCLGVMGVMGVAPAGDRNANASSATGDFVSADAASASAATAMLCIFTMESKSIAHFRAAVHISMLLDCTHINCNTVQ
jgi:hypothetical protein